MHNGKGIEIYTHSKGRVKLAALSSIRKTGHHSHRWTILPAQTHHQQRAMVDVMELAGLRVDLNLELI